jgi:hypothetical protein
MMPSWVIIKTFKKNKSQVKYNLGSGNLATLKMENRTFHVTVPDRRRRILPEVVLVRRWVIGVLGIWRGEGLGNGWDRGGQFTSNLRPRWTDSVTARRVPSKWKGVKKGTKGRQRGASKER